MTTPNALSPIADRNCGINASEGTPTNRALLLNTHGICKDFGAVQALRNVDFRISRGETVGIVGDNGAGKSTFIKILSGVLRPTSGRISYNGESLTIVSPDHARSLGIETVYQDLGLCDNMTVADNIFLGRERTFRIGPFRLLDKKAMRKAADEVLADMAVNAPRSDACVARLSGGQRQAIALARARMWESDLALLDEPTAALGVQESRRAIEIIRRMKERGLAVVMISHNMPLVLELSDRIVVLRHGHKVGDVPRALLQGDDVVALITGARQSWIEESHA